MRLHIAGLVCHPRIARGVGLIESIGGKFFPIRPNFFKHFRVVAIGFALLNEFGFHLIYDILLFLTHGLTQGIALTASEISQQSREKHHLLLIHGNAVSIFQILFHNGDIVGDERRIVLTLDKVGDIVHRPRTIQGTHGNQIFKHGGV